MYAIGVRPFFRELLRLSLCVFAVVSFLLRPEVAAQGVLQGLSLCYRSVIPALFPFFILSKLILTSPLSGVLSLPLLPYTKFVLGIRDQRAATALLLGLTGGFGGGASCLQTLYISGALSQTDANRLLFCLINAGPAFVVAGVGATMLGNVQAGWILYAALCLASLCCGAFCRIGSKAGSADASDSTTQSPPNSSPAPVLLVDCVREAVFSVLTLCGFVLFFSFFSAVLVPPSASIAVRFWLSLPLEVTAACKLAAEAGGSYQIYACCAALSLMGASIFLQVRALIPSAISLRSLLVSRAIHLPFALLFLWVLLRLFPLPLAASTQQLLRFSMPVDACCAVFLLCCTFFCITAKNNHLPFSQNKV